MFTILLRTSNGWTDYLGQSGVDLNTWNTISEAELAITDLHGVGIGCDDEWRIVPTEDLNNYKLIA